MYAHAELYLQCTLAIYLVSNATLKLWSPTHCVINNFAERE